MGEGAVEIYWSACVCIVLMTVFVAFYQQLSMKWKKALNKFSELPTNSWMFVFGIMYLSFAIHPTQST